MKFKCLNFYCIPWSYVCDGKWDCPRGYDESNVCGKNRQCRNMFKCVNTQKCIHLGDVCDGYSDCPENDDEFICSLHEIACPYVCSCITFTIHCVSRTIIKDNPLTTFLPFHIILIYNSDLLFVKQFLSRVSDATILQLRDNNLNTICYSFPSLRQTLMIDLSFNKIKAITNECFENGFKILSLSLNNNLLSFFHTAVIAKLHSLQYLDLRNNQISNIFSCILLKTSLKILVISNNTINDITKHEFEMLNVEILLTDNYHICCIVPSESLSTAKSPWYPDCSSLLMNKYVRWCCLFLSCFVVLLNMTSLIVQLFSRTSSTKSESFKTIVIPITSTDVTLGLYLLTLFIKDHVSNEKFVFKEIQWTSGPICFLAFAVILNFSMLSPLLLSYLSFMRTVVVLYPLKRNLKQRHIVVKCILSLILFTISLSIIISILQWFIFDRIPFRLCSPFVDPTGSNTLLTGITWFVVILQLCSLIFIICSYVKLLQHLEISRKNLQSLNTLPQTNLGLTFHIVTITSSNLLCWIPTGIIYLTATSVDKYPNEMIMWTTLVSTSTNSIINPLVFIVTTIKNIVGTKGKAFELNH